MMLALVMRGTPKTLADGREVDSYSTDWKFECLAQKLLHGHQLHERRAWLADWRQKGMSDAADRLEMHLRAIWAARKAADAA